MWCLVYCDFFPSFSIMTNIVYNSSCSWLRVCTQVKPLTGTCSCWTCSCRNPYSFSCHIPPDVCPHQNCTSSCSPLPTPHCRPIRKEVILCHLPTVPFMKDFGSRHFYSTVWMLSGQRVWLKYWSQRGCKFVQLLWETCGRFLKKLKIELSCGSSIPLLGISKENEIIM